MTVVEIQTDTGYEDILDIDRNQACQKSHLWNCCKFSKRTESVVRLVKKHRTSCSISISDCKWLYICFYFKLRNRQTHFARVSCQSDADQVIILYSPVTLEDDKTLLQITQHNEKLLSYRVSINIFNYQMIKVTSYYLKKILIYEFQFVLLMFVQHANSPCIFTLMEKI